MADEKRVAESSTLAPPPAKALSHKNPVRRVTLIVIAICAALFVYGIAANRYTPYTAQGLVEAYLVKIAPEVGGSVIDVGVDTDQRVEAGTVLFRIDPDPYALAVRRAEVQLEAVGQSIGASTAAVASAEAKLAEAIAKRENSREQAARTLELVKKGVYPEARRAQAQSILDSSEAVVVQAEAEIEKARQALGPTGASNPQIRDAMAVLEQANLDLQRTAILAPSEGGVTSLSLAIGQLLAKGETAMTYIDTREVWIEAAFPENSLENIAVGQPADIVLDILPGRVVTGRVVALGYGVGNRSVDLRTGLPAPRTQSGWVRPPQLMPVRIKLDQDVRPLRFGAQTNTMIYTSDNAIMNAIGYIRMRLVALLTYV
ncbi:MULTISPECIES: HlyD family secretion protein [Rhizobium]|uniref:Secretion protein HlyD family protein n=1 Tax=Rhizobium favelukesii TaxID=348824 RepID=W6RMM9_9HYPH|nr:MULTISPECIES: HlyD family secretion protein [Rhizobium]MCS0459601.1 HlyD family secretion protein [Rhizobium favelukesii]UFS80240.1 HlyD family secretion protein [Rhizobium sp. T136]CDM62029.1 secretion protein HlyD family protein [Rhizobium favelukesii]